MIKLISKTPYEVELEVMQYWANMAKNHFVIPSMGISSTTLDDWLRQVRGQYSLNSVISSLLLSDDLYKQTTYTRSVATRMIYGVFRPVPGEKDPEKMSIYKTYDDCLNDKRTAMRPGRALRYMFPFLSGSIIEEYANRWSEAYRPAEYTVKDGDTMDDFVEAYSAELVTENVANETRNRYSSSFKSLANSCMQGAERFEESLIKNVKHPAAVYGSGDFGILTVWDRGKLAARSVYRKANKSAGPIYFATSEALKLIERVMEERGIEVNLKPTSWDGASLVKIKYYYDSYIVPYIDLDTGLAIRPDRLEFKYSGDLGAHSTSGYSPVNEELEEEWYEDDEDYVTTIEIPGTELEPIPATINTTI